MRKVAIFKGKEITDDIISKVKEIAKKRYAIPIYNSKFCCLERVDDLAELHDINIEEEILALGKDWFLCYKESKNIIEFLEWVALNESGTKFIQAIEMMKFLQQVFIQHNEKKFTAAMRHNSSYPFYLEILKKGYIKELSHTIDIDICNGFAPERLKYLKEEYLSLENFLNSEEASNNPEYLSYILHCLDFNVTNKFLEKSMRLTKR